MPAEGHAVIQHQVTVAVTVAEVEGGVWQARGENLTLFLESDSRSELIGSVVGAVQALGQWIVDTRPEGESLEGYCRSLGVDYQVVEIEEGLELAVRELHEAVDHASKLLSVTQRIPF